MNKGDYVVRVYHGHCRMPLGAVHKISEMVKNPFGPDEQWFRLEGKGKEAYKGLYFEPYLPQLEND